ncbi:glycoside hydrolase family 15 protein [Teratosphaeria destructans]|uniref:Glycoside hydrolase family 15 protein n=1 Tax=Teratosphaeria destructans TaxID=418781 RepID=A0A9W7SY34_9PEZI|nr:glycoside hydrolase family 15 protein [Teratosphaeria destructans]
MAPDVAPPSEEHERLDPTHLRAATGYMPIEDYGLIGNMRTAALVAKDGAMDFLCWPNFDSPSVFARILDKSKGGYFTISPIALEHLTTKQQYLPSSNVLQTLHFQEHGVMKLEDFFPRPREMKPLVAQEDNERHDKLRKWVVRRVGCLRGEINVCVRCAPAFNYAQDSHTMEIKSQETVLDGEQAQFVIFRSKGLDLEIRATSDRGDCDQEKPQVNFEKSDEHDDGLGPACVAKLHLKEGQRASFILRDHVSEDEKPERITPKLLDRIEEETRKYWFSWIQKSHCTGRYQEVVQRSLFTLKLLTFEPTGAIVAAPTFSLPELFEGSRNWDYRFSWVRDSSFTIYILLRMGFREEAEAYMNFIEQRILHDKTADGALPIMFSIHGKAGIPETELSHLSGYRGSAPVRIGNGAATHKQLDIYGELMDGIYLYNKYGKPIGYDTWLSVRSMTDYVCSIWHDKDMSIWEVRGEVQNFVYSKVMLWVAVDRALRLAEKRCFPCPNREHWLRTRDSIMEEVMDKGYNKQMKCFIQSYEHPDVLDSALLIAPLVFFIAPNDPRFLSTLEKIMLPIEKGGLTSAGMVHRYNTRLSNDGVGGEEGAFSMCTFWLIEALTRAGQYDDKYLDRAVTLFENTLGFANHVGLFSEEINHFGEQLGNTPQAFSHLALISAAFNLDRASQGRIV